MTVTRVKLLLSLLYQRYIIESSGKKEFIVIGCLVTAMILYVLRNKQRAMQFFMQAHRSTRSRLLKKRITKSFIQKNLALCGYCSDLTEGQRQRIGKWLRDRTIILKAPLSADEKGVLLIKFTPVLEVLPRALDMEKLLERYTLVIEPSWSGICQPEVLQFCHYKQQVHVMAPEDSDYEFLDMLESNLKPTRLGPGDWVDASSIAEHGCAGKSYDIVMNSNWGAWKRHYVLFRALQKMPATTRVALIGFPYQGESRSRIEDLANYYGVSGQIEFFERIEHSRVMEIVSTSKVGVLMSLKEGANKSISECILAGLPVVILDRHIGGARGKINAVTGCFSTESSLSETLIEVIKTADPNQVRKWGLDNISSSSSTEKLNETLKSAAAKANRPWSRDIVEKRNSPELEYVNVADRSAVGGLTVEEFLLS